MDPNQDTWLAAASPDHGQAQFLSLAERIRIGKSLRDRIPRKSHAVWRPSADRRDPIEILEQSNQDRLPELIPIRYGRMIRSPFTFLRGSAALMAYDLAQTPTTGIHVQACGDCHLLNFGLFATPERNLVFDLNDFDETHPAPWEWDLKRLVASFVVAGRDNNISDKDCESAVIECARSYRKHLRRYSRMSPLDVWYNRLDMQTIIDMAPDAKARKFRERVAEKARQRIIEHLFPRIVGEIGGRHRFVDQPPVLFHVAEEDFAERMLEGLEDYRQTLSAERRVLLDRYRLEDSATKVVGIGSVGTRCFISLFFSEENHPLILQVKEARRSVLEPYTNPCRYENQGQRVVTGQRLMQSSSDIFLGWVRGRRGFDFYVRQLRDMKLSFPIEGVSAAQLKRYGEFCGWTLARAHAKSGDGRTISGYLGKGDDFDLAMGCFAFAYAEQTVKDHQALVEAVQAGRVEALVEEDL
ncbi:MAG: DUF2252 domain-containing protein [Synechococcaceae cyanobacterium]